MKKPRAITVFGSIKVLIFIQVLNIYCVNAITGSYIPYCTQLTGIMSVALMLYHMWEMHTNIRFLFTKAMVLWFAFIIYSFATLLFLRPSPSELLDLIEKTIFIIIICYITYCEKSLGFTMQMGIIISLVCAATALVLSNIHAGRVSLSSTSSSNELGNIVAIGFVCLMYYKPKNSIMGNWIFKLIASGVYITTIIQSASRQSLVVMAIVFLFRLFLCHRPTEQDSGKLSGLSVVVGVIAIAVIAYALYIYLPQLFDSLLFERIFGENRTASVSDDVRLTLYRNGISLWKARPIFGVGYNCARQYIGYSHSTYIEILAGSGLVGAILYFGSYICLIGDVLARWNNTKPGSIQRFNAKYMLCVVGIMLFLCIFRAVHFYIMSILLFAILMAYDCVIRSKDERNDEL